MNRTVELLMIDIDGVSVMILDIPNDDVAVSIRIYQLRINNS
jgi:hypothetical protein